MTNFESFNLPPFLMQALERMRITVPTPIQAQAMQPAIDGQDILASAQTGTGKTIAYSIPLIIKLLNNPRGSAIILTPTRELAIQVKTTFEQLLGDSASFGMALLIGGEPIPKQFALLRKRPRLIVGTPGRINDHLSRGTLMLATTSFLVLDETDRMLDMGFNEQLEEIARFLPKVRQTLMFSATLPPNIVKLSQKYLTNPQRISVGSAIQPIEKIEQNTIHTQPAEKFSQLLKELEHRAGSIIVFVKTKRGAEKLAYQLQRENHSADAIHGDLQQRKRERVILAFRNQKSRIMVATDIAARGLDVPHVQHVINYDLPQCPEDYIHRIGRTGRAGAQGQAISFISPEDRIKWRAINKLMFPEKHIESPHEGGGRSFGGNRRPQNRRSGGSGSSNFRRSEGRPQRSEGFRAERSEGFRSERSEGFRPERRQEFRTERPAVEPRTDYVEQSAGRDESKGEARKFYPKGPRKFSDGGAGPRKFNNSGPRGPRKFSDNRGTQEGPRRFSEGGTQEGPRRYSGNGDASQAPRRFSDNGAQDAPRRFADRGTQEGPRRSSEGGTSERSPRRYSGNGDASQAPRRKFSDRGPSQGGPRKFSKDGPKKPSFPKFQ